MNRYHRLWYVNVYAGGFGSVSSAGLLADGWHPVSTITAPGCAALLLEHAVSVRAPLALEQARLSVLHCRCRAGVDALAPGQVQGDQVAEQGQVEEAGDVLGGLGADLHDVGHHLVHGRTRVEGPAGAGVLAVVAERHQGQAPGG